MHKKTLFILLIMCAIVATFLVMRSPQENPIQGCTLDAKICPDGSSVGRTGPSCEFSACPPLEETPPVTDPMIILDTPLPNQVVTSPLIITGKARGNWFFEASFPITIVNWDGLIIGEGIATAQGDWMTAEFVPFTASIAYSLATETPYARGALILKKDNPSGLPEHDDSREIPITFSEIVTP